jgi:thioesterase domain-containing protein
MARCYIQAIRGVQPSGPYLVAGFSAGGVVAFEMAQQLCDSGERVALLGLFDAAVFSQPAGPPVETAANRHSKKLRKLKRGLQRFRTMTSSERRESLLRNWSYYSQVLASRVRAHADALARKCGITLQGPSKMKDAFLLALQQYRGERFHGTVVLYRATNGVGRYDERPAMGWDSVAPRVTVEMIDAGHPGILTEPGVIAVASSLNQRICDALESNVDASNGAPALHGRESPSGSLASV